ncbi:phosphoesterase [Leptospira semungkisensis]|uniref:Phosphoesterase n=1 Tax=Leptospira semungkisensis TaxID=2484985 RepID=A0A4R9G7W9_9LEPT|nr:metallophosphoesterase [Leptospira semungkisensis]TGK07736.1 phosphoesterase [Leptospira semungkisensis]
MATSKIKYVVISDVHFGAYNSLLTYIEEFPDPVRKEDKFKVNSQKTSPALIELLACLKIIVQSVNGASNAPQFILLGDILELALGDINEASMTFERFLEVAYKEKKPVFSDKIIYIPGNHDHHLWETARERQYIDYIAGLKPNQYIEDAWYTTKMVDPDFVESHLLTGILRRNSKLKKGKAVIAYPNYEIVSKKGDHSVFLSHGNYLENIYALMSTIQRILLPEIDEDKKKPKPRPNFWQRLLSLNPFQSFTVVPNSKSITVLEKENFAWIDFFWSTLGRSGKVGKGIGLLYDMLQDEKAMGKLTSNITSYIFSKIKTNMFLKSILFWPVSNTLKNIVLKVGQDERGMSDNILSEEVITNLNTYLEDTIPHQWEEEIKNKKRTFPKDYTFIFGHTHKPFASLSQNIGLRIQDKLIFNTGGWVVDTIQIMKSHGGSILLIDDDANVVSFRAYMEKDIKPSFIVPEGRTNPLYETVTKKVNFSDRRFQAMTKAFEDEIRLRRQVLKVRVQE